MRQPGNLPPQTSYLKPPPVAPNPLALLSDKATTTEKIESILATLDMSKEELKAILEAVMGKGQAAEVKEIAFHAIQGEQQEELLSYLDTLQRLKLLEQQGHILGEDELAHWIESAKGAWLDKKKLQLIWSQEIKRTLNREELRALGQVVSRMEYAAIAGSIVAGSNTGTQAKLLEQLTAEQAPQGERITLGEHNQLALQPVSASRGPGELQERLCRLDYTMDMKRLAESAKQMAQALQQKPLGEIDHKSRDLKQEMAAEAVDAPTKANEPLAQNSELTKLVKATQAGFKALLEGAVQLYAQFVPPPKKEGWQQDGDGRDIFELIDKAKTTDTKKKDGGEIAREVSRATTNKLQQRLQVLDHQHDLERIIVVERDQGRSNGLADIGAQTAQESVPAQQTDMQNPEAAQQQGQQSQPGNRANNAAANIARAQQQQARNPNRPGRQNRQNRQQNTQQQPAQPRSQRSQSQPQVRTNRSRTFDAQKAMQKAEAETHKVSDEKDIKTLAQNLGKDLAKNMSGEAKEAQLDDVPKSNSKLKDPNKKRDKDQLAKDGMYKKDGIHK